MALLSVSHDAPLHQTQSIAVSQAQQHTLSLAPAGLTRGQHAIAPVHSLSGVVLKRRQQVFTFAVLCHLQDCRFRTSATWLQVDFQKFIIELHTAFDEMEFAMLDVDNTGWITGLDLARSLAAPASIKVVDRLLDRVRFSLVC